MVLGIVVGLVVVPGVIGAVVASGSHTVTVGVGSRESPAAFTTVSPGSHFRHEVEHPDAADLRFLTGGAPTDLAGRSGVSSPLGGNCD